MVLSILVLLIILPAQCNARVGPYNYMERATHFAPGGEKYMQDGDHGQVTARNQDLGGRGGVLPSKDTPSSLPSLPKESAVPLSAASKGSN